VSKGYQAVIHQYVNGTLQSLQVQMEQQLNSQAHYTHKEREIKKRKKRNRINEQHLMKKKMEKQKPHFSTVILSSGEEYKNYTHTFPPFKQN
jgi:hypothetical protein